MAEAKDKVPEGLLTSIISKTPLAGLGVVPQLSERDIVVELTTEQFKQMILSGADERAKQSVSVEIHEGKILLKIRLF